MSETPAPCPGTPAWAGHPLRLDFFAAGTFRRTTRGWVHAKTVPYAILAQAVEGTYELRLGARGRRRRIGAGRVLVVPAHVAAEFTHRDGADGEFEARWLHLRFVHRGREDFLNRYELPVELGERESAEIGALIARALAMTAERAGEDPDRLVCEQDVGGRALAILCGAARRRVDAERRPGRWPGLAAVVAQVRANPAAPVDGAGLARAAGLSPARFHAVFRAELGVTPMAFVRAVRLEEAARFLVATDAKLARAAEATGFADAFHLSHAFKARFGVSPREYRRNAARLQP